MDVAYFFYNDRFHRFF